MVTIYLGLGSNIEPETYLEAGLSALSDALGELTCSSIYQSAAVGFQGADFWNMVVAAQTNLSIAQVVQVCKNIELDHGRAINAQKFTARTLDIDLLWYDGLITQTPIKLPRADILEYAFVLRPLAEIAPSVIHPELGQSFQMLAEKIHQDQHLSVVKNSVVKNAQRETLLTIASGSC